MDKNFQKNNPKILNAWASYDLANSAYNLTITAAVFPVYYETVTQQAFGGEDVVFFGVKQVGSVLYAYALSLSFLLAAILSPLLSGVADYGGKKKLMMKFFTYTGATACFSLFFFTGENIELGIIAAIIASMGYSGAIVFYNSFLPEIASDDKLDSTSARGFSLGFFGSTIQLALSLYIILHAENFGLETGFATRLSFLFVGMWWIGFAQIAFLYLPNNKNHQKSNENLFAKGFEELSKVWGKLRKMPQARRFLLAFFFYSMGAQSMMLLAPLFGGKELHLDASKLITTILLLQIVGIAGAYLFAFVSNKKGNRFALLSMLFIWLFICAYGAYYVQTEMDFYLLAVGVGLVMGGIHLSRSTYSKLIPKDTEDTTSFFSFYDVMEKLATASGPFVYGLIELSTGSMRNSVFALTFFFIIGIILLFTIKIPKTRTA